MADLVEKEFHKFKDKKKSNPCCGKCQKELTERDLTKVEIIKTKRGSLNFYHRECIICGL